MGTPDDFSTINDFVYNALAARLVLPGGRYSFVDWSDKQSLPSEEARHANTSQDAGEADGDFAGTCSLTLLQKQATRFEEELGDEFMSQRFEVSLTYKMSGGPERKREFWRVKIISREEGATADKKAIQVKYELRYSVCKIDGRYPAADMRV